MGKGEIGKLGRELVGTEGDRGLAGSNDGMTAQQDAGEDNGGWEDWIGDLQAECKQKRVHRWSRSNYAVRAHGISSLLS